MINKEFSSVRELIENVLDDYKAWKTTSIPWFRGEPGDARTPLLPKLFREKDGKKHNELKLLQHFRMKAPSLGLPYIPPRDYVDQWLFLARHVGLPTRLLDWTEGLLIGLHFALYHEGKGAVLWMLDPDELNRKSYETFNDGDYALTWYSKLRRPLVGEDLFRIKELILTKGKYPLESEIIGNVGNKNINKAWAKNGEGTVYPFAIHPTYIHPRLSSQISRFTIHGDMENEMVEMNLGDRILRKYVAVDQAICEMKKELRMMGITRSSLYPDLDGLSFELSDIY